MFRRVIRLYQQAKLNVETNNSISSSTSQLESHFGKGSVLEEQTTSVRPNHPPVEEYRLPILPLETPSSVRGLTEEEMLAFNKNGYLVKSQLIPDELLYRHQKELREYLSRHTGVDFQSVPIGSSEESLILSQQESLMSNVSNGFGGMINFYHGKSMYAIREQASLHSAFTDLFKSTYSKTNPQEYLDENEWPNEYCDFEPSQMYMFINRCGFRIPHQKNPENIMEGLFQKGTGTHLDCNPFHLFKGEKLNPENNEFQKIPLRFWQPIQAFVSLTDTLETNQGGFWTIPGFHKESVAYFKNHYNHLNSENSPSYPVLKRGNAFDIDDNDEIVKSMEFIPLKRGDVIFWDWRLPHSNDKFHFGEKIREVIYLAHIPKVPINESYTENQKKWFLSGKHPSYVAKKFAELETENYKPVELSHLGKKLLNFTNW